MDGQETPLSCRLPSRVLPLLIDFHRPQFRDEIGEWPFEVIRKLAASAGLVHHGEHVVELGPSLDEDRLKPRIASERLVIAVEQQAVGTADSLRA